VDDGREVLILRGRGEDDPLRACLSVLLQVFTLGENTRALEHDLDVHLLPGELRGVALLQEAYATLAVDHEVVPVELYRPVIAPVDGVILKQIGNIRGVGDVVDGDQFKLRGVHQNLERRAANPPHAVNRDSRCHSCVPPRLPTLSLS